MVESQYLEIVGWVITGGVVTALVNNLGDFVMWLCGRKATLSDKKDELKDQTSKAVKNTELLEKRLTESNRTLQGVVEGMRLILYDRIKFIGTGYINKQCIDFEDRAVLNRMTTLYTQTLHGDNAVDLEILMEEINHLPLSHHSNDE